MTPQDLTLPLSRRISPTPVLTMMPPPLRDEAKEAGARVSDPEEAARALTRFLPALDTVAPEPDFLRACGQLVEKCRLQEGMLEFWSDLYDLIPGDALALRMMMRWYRRARMGSEGLSVLTDLFPDCATDPTEAERVISGLMELHEYERLDTLMAGLDIPSGPATRIGVRYVQCLMDQSRYLEAELVARELPRRGLGPASLAALERAGKGAALLRKSGLTEGAAILAHLVGHAPPPAPCAAPEDGPIVFVTGQLGTGGAERQLTRLAAAFETRHAAGEGPAIEVCVRHATPSRGADFFLPVLKAAGVRTTVMTDLPDFSIDAVSGLAPDTRALIDLLPSDLRQATAKLIPWFRERAPSVAYIWQDGAVLSAAVAALLAGVPRIVTSFRGLPPSQRPQLFRAPMPSLYSALARLPHVTFSANAASTARAYEDWLDLDRGSIAVVPNATPPITPDGSEADVQWWDDAVAKAPDCDRTVLGIFRFEQNKRPLDWVETAAACLEARPNTRFVIVGDGLQREATQARIDALGLGDRIHLAGVREQVGFFLHRADMVMHLAEMEGLPNVLIEAHLTGRPVLATPAGGTAEVVEDHVTGRLLPSAANLNPEEAGALLAELLSDNDTLDCMGEAARVSAESRFLIDTVLDRTLSLWAHPAEG
ncbi:MAG: glycosyltransferase [Pseudomonadota bacterium]